jgi:uncharacterized membrane protein YfcA
VRALAVLVIAFGASLLASLSGGSSSMITTPAWVALGVSFPVAVASDKIAGMFWTVSAARTYLANVAVDRRLLMTMGVVGLAGAFAGAVIATSVDQHLLRRGAGLLILLALLAGRTGAQAQRRSDAPADDRIAILGFPLGLYEGLLGSGNGILTSSLLIRARGFDLPTALGHYYALAALWCALAAGVYFARGAVDWRLALPATVGALAGGTLGARIGRQAGSKLVRPLFVVVGLVLAVRLLFF